MNKRRRTSPATAGFTLVELMVVIAIIAILATIVGVSVLGRMDEAMVTTAQAQIKSFEQGIVAYKIRFRRLPDTLEALARPPKGEPLMKNIPLDPWGNPYLYEPSGSKYTIISHGADGRPGGSEYDADISSENLGAANQPQ